LRQEKNKTKMKSPNWRMGSKKPISVVRLLSINKSKKDNKHRRIMKLILRILLRRINLRPKLISLKRKLYHWKNILRKSQIIRSPILRDKSRPRNKIWRKILPRSRHWWMKRENWRTSKSKILARPSRLILKRNLRILSSNIKLLMIRISHLSKTKSWIKSKKPRTIRSNSIASKRNS
jgi:hypothetical protein